MKNLLAYLLLGIGIYVIASLSFLFLEDFLKFGVTFLFTILILISIIPMLLYVAFKRPEDNGGAGGFVGYYLVKLFRKLK